MAQEQTDKEATGGSEASRVTIRFESVSGDSLQKRFNTLARSFGKQSQPLEWTAQEFKKCLIRNIENGTIVVSLDDGKQAFA
jgi:hypothetical protein